MDLETIRAYCSAKPGVTGEFPFDERTLVFKVMGKMFALIDVIEPETLNLKCDPEKAVGLRERYDEVRPGYHMNKVHWNTVHLGGAVPHREIFSWIDDSYNLVVKGLKKSLRQELEKIFCGS